MEKLINDAKRGDERAFTMLILNYQQELYKIALTRLKTKYDIDEAIQETMISAFKNIKKLKENEKFKSWIIKILINKCNDIYRKNKKNIMSIEEMSKECISTEIDSKVGSKLDFYDIIKQLNEEEKTIVILYYSDKFTTKEIGKILNKNENTVKTIIHRIKIKLRNNYNRFLETN